MKLYPLRFREILRHYSFGRRWIDEAFEKTHLPAEGNITETWEVCDRPTESSEISNGPLAGRSLRDAIDSCGEELLGRDIVARFGMRFPLLVKFLDVSGPLVAQVHQDDELVRARGLDDYSGKTEAWYMVRTRPGSTVFCGSRADLTAEQLHEAMLANDSRSCMVELPAQAQDVFLLYSGTMHASAGGQLLYEVMQNSDVGLGLDVRRDGLSDEEVARGARDALEAVRLEDGADPRPKAIAIGCGDNTRTIAVACEHFVLERLDLAGPYSLTLDGRRFVVLTTIEGRARARCEAGCETLLAGNTCLLPACLGEVAIEPQGAASLLVSYVPDLAADVIAPLRARGIADDAIAALAGAARRNPIRALLREARGRRG